MRLQQQQQSRQSRSPWQRYATEKRWIKTIFFVVWSAFVWIFKLQEQAQLSTMQEIQFNRFCVSA